MAISRRVKNVFNRAIAAVAGAAYRLDSSLEPMPNACHAQKDDDMDEILYVGVNKNRIEGLAMVLGEGRSSRSSQLPNWLHTLCHNEDSPGAHDGEVVISPDDKLLFKGVKLVIVDGIGVQTTNRYRCSDRSWTWIRV